MDSLLVLHVNMRQGWKTLRVTNTLAYFIPPTATKKKKLNKSDTRSQ